MGFIEIALTLLFVVFLILLWLVLKLSDQTSKLASYVVDLAEKQQRIIERQKELFDFRTRCIEYLDTSTSSVREISTSQIGIIGRITEAEKEISQHSLQIQNLKPYKNN